MDERALSSSRLARFFWEHRFHPLLLPLLALSLAWTHGAIAALSILANGGNVVGVELWPSFGDAMRPGFYYWPAELPHPWLVALAPIAFWVALAFVTAIRAPRMRNRSLGRAASLFGLLGPAVGISATLAFAVLMTTGNVLEPLRHNVAATMVLGTTLLAILGRLGFTVFRELWGSALSVLEFTLLYCGFLATPWLFFAAISLGQS